MAGWTAEPRPCARRGGVVQEEGGMVRRFGNIRNIPLFVLSGK